MRVISGSARGLHIEAPGDLPVRPSLDRVREAVFSILTPRLDGAHFLDLFAGTGANGIEALSRGAPAATFVDNHPAVIALIRRNLVKTRLHAAARVLLLNIPADFARLSSSSPDGFGIIYLDPPHDFGPLPPLLEALENACLLAPQGIVVVEHLSGMAMPDTVGGWSRTRQAAYGRTTLSFYQ